MKRVERHQRGVAAIELCLILFGLLFLVPTLFLFGRVFWYYNVLKGAAHGAAQYVAALPVDQMADPAIAGLVADQARMLVVGIAQRSGVDPVPSSAEFGVMCDNGNPSWMPAQTCTNISKGNVIVVVRAKVLDTVFGGFTDMFTTVDPVTATRSIELTITSTVPYANRAPAP